MHNLRVLALFLILDFLALLYGASTLSISVSEARDFFDPLSFSSFFAHLGVYLFGRNDFGLRFFQIILHLASCILIYSISLKYVIKKQDAIYSVLLFMLLPGTIASALIFNPAALIIFLSLSILWAYFYKERLLFYALLVLVLFVDKTFMFVFIALFFYGLYKKDAWIFIPAGVLFGVSISLYGFEAGGKPHSYLLDTLGIYAACFSPLVFLYFFYCIYKLCFSKEKDIFYFLSATTFIFCLLLSLRQKLFMDDFLPFCVICTPLLVKMLMSSYRVRLKEHRLKYNVLIICSLSVLLLSYVVMVLNPLLDNFIKNPENNFAYPYHVAKTLAKNLKEKNVTKLSTNSNLALRLKFYGIKQASKPLLFKSDDKDYTFKIKLGKSFEYYKLSY